LIFTFYVLSFILDLWPSVRSKTHVPQGWREREAVLEKDAERNGGLTSLRHEQPAPAVSDPNQGTHQNTDSQMNYDRAAGSYRGTNMTGGQGSHLQNAASAHNDLGRQKKWGIGRLRF